MGITQQQKTFFETFGYLHLPGVLAPEMAMIREEYEAIYARQAANVVPLGAANPDGVHWATTIQHLFVAMSPRLSCLIEDPRMVDICTSLLGEGYSINGGDGTLFHTATAWHSDATGDVANSVRHIKISCYLDPLTASTGALRVMPGSHLNGDAYADALSRMIGDSPGHFGEEAASLPGVALETRPGDLVVFDHRTKHASFGGARRRRLMCLNVQGPLATARQRELILDSWRQVLRSRPDADWYPGFIASSPPERLKHLAASIELLAQARAELAGQALSASI